MDTLKKTTFLRPYIALFRPQKSRMGRNACFAQSYNARFAPKNVNIAAISRLVYILYH